MAIKNVVFDLGGVLIDWNPRYVFREVFGGDVEKMEYFLSHICTPEWNAQTDAGKPFAKAVEELSALHPEYKDQIMLYATRWKDMLNGTIPEGMALLQAVRRAGVHTIYALTNWSAETFPYAFSHFAFLEDFEGIVVSGEEKMIKPDKRIYMVLLERYHLNGAECLYIDDRQENVDMAINRGFEGMVFGPDRRKSAQAIADYLGIKL